MENSNHRKMITQNIKDLYGQIRKLYILTELRLSIETMSIQVVIYLKDNFEICLNCLFQITLKINF